MEDSPCLSPCLQKLLTFSPFLRHHFPQTGNWNSLKMGFCILNRKKSVFCYKHISLFHTYRVTEKTEKIICNTSVVFHQKRRRKNSKIQTDLHKQVVIKEFLETKLKKTSFQKFIVSLCSCLCVCVCALLSLASCWWW